MPDPVADILRTVQTSDRVRAAAWDAAYGSDDPEDVANRLRALPIGDSARAKLWDARFAAAEEQAPITQPEAPVSEARTQRPGQFVNEMLRNVPSDLIRQATNVTTGTVDLLSVLAKATGEVGAGAGNFIRESIGLEPNESAGTENLQTLGRMPGAVASHYAQYADPNYRAERVRNEPVGMALDVLPVRAGLQAAAQPARAVAGAARRGASAAANAPGRVIDTAIGVLTKRPLAAIRGAAGQGPVERGVSTLRGALAPEADVTPAASAPASVAAPSAPPASRPAVPAPSAARSVPETAPASTAGPTPSRPSPQMVQNQLGIQARRQGLTLTEPQYKAATELVNQGQSPAVAVAEVAKRATTPAPSASAPAQTAQAPKAPAKAPKRARLTADEADEYLRLTEKGMTNEEAVEALMAQRKLAKKLGTPSPESVRRRVADRNTTGRWPED